MFRRIGSFLFLFRFLDWRSYFYGYVEVYYGDIGVAVLVYVYYGVVTMGGLAF